MRHLLGITGSPGTGKKTVAPIVSERLGLEFHSINDLATKFGVVSNSGEVDTARLRQRVASAYRKKVLLFGHLVPYSVPPNEVIAVAVLRCDPRTLKRRLESRGYDVAKVRENVDAELIGLVAHDARRTFGGRAFEVDTTASDPLQVARAVLNGFKQSKRPSKRIDWTEDYNSSSKLLALGL